MSPIHSLHQFVVGAVACAVPAGWTPQRTRPKEEDAAELFHMLDASHDGFIQSDDFLNGCLRLDGPAKAIDLAAFIEESRKVNRTFLEHAA